MVSILVVVTLLYIGSFENLPNNVNIIVKWAAAIVIMETIYNTYSKFQYKQFPLLGMMIHTKNTIKLKEKHYIIDDSLPATFLHYLDYAAKVLPREADLTAFPGEKIFFKMTPVQKKQILKHMVSIDPGFKKYTTHKTTITAWLGIVKRSTVVSKLISPNAHTDQDDEGVGILTYLNAVGGGTAMFKRKRTGNCLFNHPFSFEVKDIPTNPYWEMVERFDNKANRTILFPVNELHTAFYDLTAWPENVAERLTLNIVVRIGS